MMPGSHIPPAVPIHQGRRQSDYHYHIPPQTHSPVHHNPYANYHHPQYHGAPHASPYPPQWYPYPQPQHQYTLPPRPYQPHGSPVVVSSHPHMQHIPPVNRQLGQTPPIAHTRTPPVPRNHTPQPVPSTPSASSQTHISSPTTTTNMTTPTPPPSTPSRQSRPSFSAPPPPPPVTQRMPFYPALPWLSVPDSSFPPASRKKKKRRTAPVLSTDDGLKFPAREQAEQVVVKEEQEEKVDAAEEQTPTEELAESQTSTAAPVSDLETPATSQAPSEADSTQPTTPSSAMPPPASVRPPAPASHARTATKPVVPLIPIKPAVPPTPSVTSTTQKSVAADKDEPNKANTGAEVSTSTQEPQTASPPTVKAAPKSWAELLRSKAAPANSQTPTQANGVIGTNGTTPAKSNSLADVLASYSVDSDNKVAFLEPRGLVNTGNLCYMNSILQVLLFCVPFYDFLDQVAKTAVHSFKSETPLVDAMIMFMRDFKVIDSAVSAEKLRLRLKDTELEQYGEPLTPSYVYDMIRRLPRFDGLKRGQQEDAEEFLGYLLHELTDECAKVIQGATGPTSLVSEDSAATDAGWHEVGPKQRAAVTQSSGAVDVETPVTRIFGGKFRSEVRRPGEKLSVTFEPYQPLQLDIGSPEVHNITDALKGLTHLETLSDSNTPRGAKSATKQVFIESLPHVLILHLKRFHYEATGGAQKIWKKVGYPLELTLPKEVFPPHKRNSFNVRGGLPRYRLTAAVYHHGKNASGGHYTVDLRRQEGAEWIRVDDTIIRRVRAEDVAEGGAEEDPKILAAALEQHKQDSSRNRNFYEQFGVDEEETKSEGGWNQVNGSEKKDGQSGKKWAGVVNGAATPSTAGKRTPLPKEGVKDNKVAYILFYQRIDA